LYNHQILIGEVQRFPKHFLILSEVPKLGYKWWWKYLENLVIFIETPFRSEINSQKFKISSGSPLIVNVRAFFLFWIASLSCEWWDSLGPLIHLRDWSRCYILKAKCRPKMGQMVQMIIHNLLYIWNMIRYKNDLSEMMKRFIWYLKVCQ